PLAGARRAGPGDGGGGGGGRRARRRGGARRGARFPPRCGHPRADPASAAHRPTPDRAGLCAERPPAPRGHPQPRRAGPRAPVEAARAAGTRRILAQSIAFIYAPGPPGTVHGEQDPLLEQAPKSFRRSAGAVAELERAVLAAQGVVLRYGYFYGPGSAISR